MLKKTLIALSLVKLLSACTNHAISEKQTELENQIKKAEGNIQSQTANFSIVDSAYVSLATEKEEDSELQASFYSQRALSLQEVLEAIELQFNIPYYIVDNEQEQDSEQNEPPLKRKVNFKGKLNDFMEYVGNAFSVSLKVKNDVLEVNHYITQTYSLNQYIDNSSWSTTLSVGGGATSAGGLKSVTEQAAASNTWEQIDTYLSKLIGDKGSYVILEDFSLVSVTAKPSVIEAIDELFEKVKAESEIQVALHYRVVSIDKSTLNRLNTGIGIDLRDGSFTLSSELIDSLPNIAGGTGSLAIGGKSISGRLDVITTKLANHVVTEGQFVGLPNRLMPINLTTTSSYISGVEREQNDDINKTTVSVSTDEIQTGISMMLLPKVLDDGRIQITSGYTRKELLGIETTQDGIQLPTISEDETLTTVTLDSGDVELITLFQEAKGTDQNVLKLLGVGEQANQSDKVIGVFIGVDSYKLSSIHARG